MEVKDSTKSDFFGSKVIISVNYDTNPLQYETLRKQLEDLTFDVDVEECDQLESIAIYHKQDLIRHDRIEEFIKYATWLKRA